MQSTDTKKRYNIVIADVQLSILSDESEEFVTETVSRLDGEIRTMTLHNKRCAKIDAAILCALDALGEKMKLEKKLKNLEAQVSLYEANLRRLRGENAAAPIEAATAAEDKAPAEKTDEKAEETPAPAKTESAKEKKPAAKKKTTRQITVEESVSRSDETKAETDTPAEDAAPTIHGDKLKQIESLLRRRSEEETDTAAPAPAEDDSREGKLRQIEELLRAGDGNRTLTEALQDALQN